MPGIYATASGESRTSGSATMVDVVESGTYPRREWRVLSAETLDEIVPA
jgi:hypothetical protein